MLASFLTAFRVCIFFVLQATEKLGGAWEQGNLNTTLPALYCTNRTPGTFQSNFVALNGVCFTCSQMSYCTAHLRTISDTALVMYLLWRLFTTQGLYQRRCPCAYTRPTNSLVTRSVALSGNPSGMLYSSFVIFWKHRYSFLGQDKHIQAHL